MNTSLSCRAFSLLAFLFLILFWSRAGLSQRSATPPSPIPGTKGSAAPPSQAPVSTASAPSRYRITGTVINSVTKSPVPRVELTVAHMNSRRSNGRGSGRQQGQVGSAMTDAAGRFEVEVPSAGGWSLTASAHGYHTQAFDEHENYSTAIVLTEAAPAFDLVFRLPPSSAIEGYVLDEAGEPVRDAQLTVSLIPPVTPDDARARPQIRGSQRTDDRGYYKLSGLLAGNYQLRLQAQPWYATAASGPRFDRISGSSGIKAVAGSIGSAGSSANSAPNSATSAPDPLDVVYPILWYPGVTELTAANPIALRAGEVREADFRLSPMPSFHLRIPAEAPTAAAEARRPAVQSNTYLSQILPDGTEAGVPASIHTDAQGNMDLSGLGPGTYLIHRPGEFTGSGTSAATIQISPNSPRTVDATQASSATPVTVKIDPAADLPSLQINFRDLASGRITSAQGPQNFASRGQRRGVSGVEGDRAPTTGPSADRPSDALSARTINLQPGRYEVFLNGIGDLHLTGIDATGATAMGRTIVIGSGAPTLMLHVASGRSNVTGFVRSHGAPASGAMVLLVPATLGDPSSLDFIRRDQSNTDGSFDILDVLPGAYILVAIDRGWEVNWRDPATLRRFLMHGLPLDLTAPGDRTENIEAQSP